MFVSHCHAVERVSVCYSCTSAHVIHCFVEKESGEKGTSMLILVEEKKARINMLVCLSVLRCALGKKLDLKYNEDSCFLSHPFVHGKICAPKMFPLCRVLMAVGMSRTSG